MQGQGELKRPEGETYKGSFVNNKKHGKGELITQDGSKIYTTWDQGFMDGEGVMIKPHGKEIPCVFVRDLIIPLEN